MDSNFLYNSRWNTLPSFSVFDLQRDFLIRPVFSSALFPTLSIQMEYGNHCKRTAPSLMSSRMVNAVRYFPIHKMGI